jgi:hypothetical protein
MDGTSGFVSVQTPFSTDIPNGRLALQADEQLGRYATVVSGAAIQFGVDTDVAYETTATLQSSSSPNVEMVTGLVAHGFGLDAEPRAQPGLRFLRIPGLATWQAAAKTLAAETIVDTGIAASSGVRTRLRIEFRGANVNGGTSAAYFFIDGTHVATITTNLPIVDFSRNASVLFGIKNATGASAVGNEVYFGHVNYACNFSPAVTS